MNNRIKTIRSESNLSQEDFGKKIGITKSSVSLLESGRNNPSDQTVKLLCQEFGVNEHWLRTGEGDIFIKKSRSEEIAEFAANLMKEEDESFKRRLIEALAKLDEGSWEMLEKLALDIVGKKKE